MPNQSDTKPVLFTLRRFSDSKRRSVVLMFLVLGALVLLTVGLKSLSFQPPAQFNFEQQESNAGGFLDLLDSRGVFIVVAFILMLVILILLVSRINRSGVSFFLAGVVLIAFIIYITSTNTIKEVAEPVQIVSTPVAGQIYSPTAQVDGVISVVKFQPPRFSDWLLLLFSLAVVSFFVFIVWLLFLWRRLRLPVTSIQPLEEIGETVRHALDELETGVGERDTVIQCYARMNEIVMRGIHVERGSSRTASEFAARLEILGLPGEAVRRLTRLFETSRYGAYASQPLEIQEARDCLVEIARYCGEPV